MKKPTWKPDGNHIVIDTLHKTFNAQADCISTGNVIGNVQFSAYVRPFTETECNGFTNAPGHLRKFDLDSFNLMPSFVRRKIEELTKSQKAIVYEFRTWRRREKVVHGYIVTSANEKDPRTLAKYYPSNAIKSWSIIDAAEGYISNGKPD